MQLFQREDKRNLLAEVAVPEDVTAADLAAPEFAFTQDAARPSTWITGSWYTAEDGTIYAQILIGSASAPATDLAVGEWAYWVRVTATPEIPVFKAGYLRVL